MKILIEMKLVKMQLCDFRLNEKTCKSYLLCVILLIIAHIVIMGVTGECIYFCCCKKQNFFKTFFNQRDRFMDF